MVIYFINIFKCRTNNNLPPNGIMVEYDFMMIYFDYFGIDKNCKMAFCYII